MNDESGGNCPRECGGKWLRESNHYFSLKLRVVTKCKKDIGMQMQYCGNCLGFKKKSLLKN